MRHRNKVKKLQRPAHHRRALLANLVCSLIEHKQIRTTVAKAKAMRPVAENMVTLGKRGDIPARRLAVAFLRHKSVVKELFDAIAPAAASRKGGYTRITKLGQRQSDSAPMAFIEWVDQPGTPEVEPAEEPKKKSKSPRGEEKKPAPAKRAAKKAAKKQAEDKEKE
jgi:large subunit ribosomal protein L17